MKDDGTNEERSSFNSVVKPGPRNYSFLLRVSRRLGSVATKSSFMQDVRHFMNRPITYDLPAKWLGSGMAMLRGDETVQHGGSSDTKDQDTEAARNQQRGKELREIAVQSHEVLMAANTVFPITLFPDTVMVDRTKVTITRRDFFWSSDVMSIRIEDVLNVSASVGPLFGSLTIASRVMSTIDHFQIRHLWRNDAILLKHLIQGYVIAQHNNIDTAHLNKKELAETLIELGHDSNS